MPTELYLCGWTEVVRVTDDSPDVNWRWDFAASGMPQYGAVRWQTTTECKPVGKRVLMASSSGGAAVVNLASKQAMFHAGVPAAHTIEWLPRQRFATASANAADDDANRVMVWDAVTMQPMAEYSHYSAHGLVWDDYRKVLWAVGGNTLRAYSFSVAKGLTVDFETELPDKDGHDLAHVPGTSNLFLSTGKGCWLFNRRDNTFVSHPELGAVAGVRSWSQHPKTGRIAYVQSDAGKWWTNFVRFLNPMGTLVLPNAMIYKARWGDVIIEGT